MIQNIKRKFLNMSIGSKLIIYCVFIIVILTTTITMFGNVSYKKSINKSQNENTNQILTQINNNVDYYVKNSESIINYLSNDPRVLEFLNKNEYIDNNLDDDVYDSIYTYTSVNEEIAGIMIVNKNGGYISDVMNKRTRDSLVLEEWYQEAYEDPHNIHIETSPVGRNIDNIFKYPADDVFSISKAVVDKKDNTVKGVILIDVKLDLIRNVIKNAKPGTAGFVYIMDSNNDIVYTPVNNIVYRIKDEWINNIGDEIISEKINGENYQLTKVVSHYTNWQTIGVFPEKQSFSIIKKIQVQSIIIGILGMIVSAILIVVFTRTIVRPIQKLKKLMKKGESGDLNVYFNVKYDDEVGQLGTCFNSMVKEVNNLMNLVQEEEKKKRIAEMNVLQAQIKPHFIYNTLDTIRWMAEENQEKEIVRIIEALTNLLRISLSKGREIITVKEEMNHILNYLVIQKIRYEDKLEYEVDFDESILEYKVIKLILQPLVENAIYHGIKEKRGQGKLVVKGKLKDNELYFTVSDNGKGMEKEKLNIINDMLNNSREKNESIGYGIFNVNERIKLRYGERFGLEYKSEIGKGTKVMVKHPLVK